MLAPLPTIPQTALALAAGGLFALPWLTPEIKLLLKI
jgi:hypothetical protein